MINSSRLRLLGGLAFWLVITFIAAAVGSVATRDAGAFYEQLTQPSWAPSSAVFAPVWTVLYALMAVAAWLVWCKRSYNAGNVRFALLVYLVQLMLNALWSWLFFGWQQGLLSFINIVTLWVLVLVTVLRFWRVRPLAGLLLLPYLIWVAYAAALNYSTWRLNPQVL